jgi:hypothetical protein
MFCPRRQKRKGFRPRTQRLLTQQQLAQSLTQRRPARFGGDDNRKTFLSQPFGKGACDRCLPAAVNALHRDEQTLRQDASSKSVLTKTVLPFCQWRRRKHEKHVHRHSWQQRGKPRCD